MGSLPVVEHCDKESASPTVTCRGTILTTRIATSTISDLITGSTTKSSRIRRLTWAAALTANRTPAIRLSVRIKIRWNKRNATTNGTSNIALTADRRGLKVTDDMATNSRNRFSHRTPLTTSVGKVKLSTCHQLRKSKTPSNPPHQDQKSWSLTKRWSPQTLLIPCLIGQAKPISEPSIVPRTPKPHHLRPN